MRSHGSALPAEIASVKGARAVKPPLHHSIAYGRGAQDGGGAARSLRAGRRPGPQKGRLDAQPGVEQRLGEVAELEQARVEAVDQHHRRRLRRRLGRQTQVAGLDRPDRRHGDRRELHLLHAGDRLRRTCRRRVGGRAGRAAVLRAE